MAAREELIASLKAEIRRTDAKVDELKEKAAAREADLLRTITALQRGRADSAAAESPGGKHEDHVSGASGPGGGAVPSTVTSNGPGDHSGHPGAENCGSVFVFVNEFIKMLEIIHMGDPNLEHPGTLESFRRALERCLLRLSLDTPPLSFSFFSPFTLSSPV